MVRCLVIGRKGQLARALGENGGSAGWLVEGRGRESLDIADPGSVLAAVWDFKPDIVINAAAFTAVDRAEREFGRAMAVNGNGPGFLAEACRGRGVPLIHVSTEYVFDGDKDDPYVEDDECRPLGIYGASKIRGENLVRSVCPNDHLIVRTAGLFSPFGRSLIKTFWESAAGDGEIRALEDRRICVTSARDLARALFVMAERLLRDRRVAGTYHFANQPSATVHEVAAAVFSVAAALRRRGDARLFAATAQEWREIARRPRNGALCCDRARQVFGLTPAAWRVEVLRCLAGIAERERAGFPCPA